MNAELCANNLAAMVLERVVNGKPFSISKSDMLPLIEQCVTDQTKQLQAIVDKRPRVFFLSSDPRSLTEGFPVVSVSGKTREDGSVWLDVIMMVDGEEIPAPDDFGLYSTAEAAKENEDG